MPIPDSALLHRLVPADAPAYRALMMQAYADEPAAFTSTVAEREGLPLAWWEARVAVGEQTAELVMGAFAGADDGPALVGVAGLQFNARERTRHKALLFGMVVAPAWRRHGLAAALVRGLLDAAASRPGVALVQLTVSGGNEGALALYRHCGFQVFGVEPSASCVDGRFIDKLHMWRPLA